MLIGIAQTPDEISACFECISGLRPHLEQDRFVTTVQRLSALNGFSLVYLDCKGIKSVAGIRMSEWLYTGKYLEIEDLVTAPNARSNGYGGKLFDWICNFARQHHCQQVGLVSGVGCPTRRCTSILPE